VSVGNVEAPLRTSLFAWSAASVGAVLLAIVFALVLARRLELPLALAAKAADELGRGATVPPIRSGVIEANIVVDAMSRASQQLAERDRRQHLLMRELAHRVKNILAVVQVVVSRTLSGGRPDADHLIGERLHALARAHDMLMKTDWQGVRLADIVGAELSAYSGQVSMHGPDLIAKGNVVQTLTLIVHELTTNAVKHGALSTPQGCVDVSWNVGGESEPYFRFRWQERGGPPVVEPCNRGFGSSLLEAAVPLSGDRRPSIRFEPGGLVYEFDAPLDDVTD
jgi:two-component sensor histidine kinase